MRLRIFITILTLLCSCFAAQRIADTPRPPQYRPFDLVPRGYDDNGLQLNPVWGSQADHYCSRGNFEFAPNAEECSWPFTKRALEQQKNGPIPCTSAIIEPD